MGNEWIAQALNALTDSCMYRASYYGIRVNIIGGGYTLTNKDAVIKIKFLVGAIEEALPDIKEKLQFWAQINVNKAHEDLIEVGGR